MKTEERRPSAEVLRAFQAHSRYLFSADEFARATGRQPGSATLSVALTRYAAQGRIVQVSKRPSRWLVVPPEHAHYGAPPADWWLDDYLKDDEPHYYLALLSAARHWGSAHYALQTIQIMVARPRRAQVVGRIRLAYVAKANIEATPVEYASSRVARFRVSTREATLLDLVRHQHRCGGLEAVARIARDFAPAMTPAAMTRALDALGSVPTAQRLGWILQTLCLRDLADTIGAWLAQRRFVPVLFETGRKGQRRYDAHWRIRHSPAQLHLVEELA